MDYNVGYGSYLRNNWNLFKYSTIGDSAHNIWRGNQIWSKIVFLILAFIVFFIILRLGILLISRIFSPNTSPKLVDGLKDATKPLDIPGDPTLANSVPILRSKNRDGGMEFTWTVWINVKRIDLNNPRKMHIFHKGSDTFNNGIAFPNNAPGLYIKEGRNALVIVMNTYDTINEEIEIGNIPINKWINIAIRQRGRVMDVFINGEVVNRHIFSDVPKQNYGSVKVNTQGGFPGLLSDLWYHNYALSGTEIIQIVRDGPNMRVTKNAWGLNAIPPYLSLKWYTQNNDNVPKKGPYPWKAGS